MMELYFAPQDGIFNGPNRFILLRARAHGFPRVDIYISSAWKSEPRLADHRKERIRKKHVSRARRRMRNCQRRVAGMHDWCRMLGTSR